MGLRVKIKRMSAQKSILFISRVYPPQRGATGRLLQDLARFLVQNGWHVTVLCTGDKNEQTDDRGVQVVRLKTTQNPRRLFSYFWILLRLTLQALTLKKRNMLVTMTDPPLMVLGGDLIRWFKKSRHIHWSQDIYPDLLVPMGSSYPAWLINFVKRRTRRAMNKAAHIVSIGRCMTRHLSHTGCETSHISTIQNWPDLELTDKNAPIFQTAATAHKSSKPFAQQIKTGQKFKILYAGNIGLLHPMEAILKAATLLQDEAPDIEFVFAGDGAGFDALAEERVKRGLNNIRFMPYQPQDRLKFMMESGDIHIVSMSESANGLLVPSKFYSALAVHRPCIFIGSKLCEAARVIEEYKAGTVIAQEDVSGLVEAITSYRLSPEKWYAGRDGAVAAAKEYTPDISLNKWLSILK
jgi:colanic acid biosynthesis glycosyl transferase WcaI